MFFDNVGGEVLDVVLRRCAERGAHRDLRGDLAVRRTWTTCAGPRNYLKLAERHARMEGFAVTHFESAFPQAEDVLGGWLADGRLAMREHVEHGLDTFPATLRMLLDGGHHGKLLLRVHDPRS